MVELFTAPGFIGGRRVGQTRFRLSPGRKLPTPAGLNEVKDPEPPRTGFGGMMPATPALHDDDLKLRRNLRHVRVAPDRGDDSSDRMSELLQKSPSFCLTTAA